MSVHQSLRGAILAVALVVPACGPSDYVTIDAEILRIERTCSFSITKTTTEPTGRTSREMSSDDSDCDSTPEFETVRTTAKAQRKRVAGKGVATLEYTPPGASEPVTGEIKLDGGDDEFYDWRRHDHVQIMMSKSDPKRIHRT